MAVTCHVYTLFSKAAISKLANVGTDALKVMLLTAYTPGQDTHEFVSDVKGAGTEVAAGGGYSTGGLALSGVSITNAAHVVTVNCSNPVWSSSSITASFAVFYDSTPGTDATNPVICYWDFGGSSSSIANTFQLTVNASGLVTFTGS